MTDFDWFLPSQFEKKIKGAFPVEHRYGQNLVNGISKGEIFQNW